MDQLPTSKPPSIVRVAAIWLTLSVAAVAGFASASPEQANHLATSAETPVAADDGSPLGTRAGLIAATSLTAHIIAVPENTERWRPLVTEHFRPQDIPLALRVIHCESSGDPTAEHRRSGALGLFQHLPRFWAERAAAAGVRGPATDPEANVAVAAWLVYEGGGWKHWNASRHCWSGRSSLG